MQSALKKCCCELSAVASVVFSLAGDCGTSCGSTFIFEHRCKKQLCLSRCVSKLIQGLVTHALTLQTLQECVVALWERACASLKHMLAINPSERDVQTSFLHACCLRIPAWSKRKVLSYSSVLRYCLLVLRNVVCWLIKPTAAQLSWCQTLYR